MVERYRPYTALGIKRVPCSRCGKPSVHQWQVCADFNRYRGVCLDCDVELNRMALEFMRIPDVASMIDAYRARRGGGR